LLELFLCYVINIIISYASLKQILTAHKTVKCCEWF